MDAEVKQRWVAALRSGEYLQDAGYLHNRGGYCCLGVLCDVENVVVWDDPFIDVEGKFNVADYDTLPPVDYQVRFGLADAPSSELREAANKFVEDGDFLLGVPDSVAMLLAAMNDNGASFEQIADFIETHL